VPGDFAVALSAQIIQDANGLNDLVREGGFHPGLDGQLAHCIEAWGLF
jgi:hypothetical protein